MTKRAFGRISRSLLGLFLAGTILGMVMMVLAAWWRPYRRYDGIEKFVVIPRGASSLEIARQLEREGVIRHWAWFLGYVRLVRHSRPLLAGEYRFDRALSIPEVADKLIRGLVYYHEVTIPEGYSSFEIAALLEQKGLANAAAFQTAASQKQLIADLVPDTPSLEGFLFPDTYRFSRSSTVEDIVQTFVNRFREVYHQGIEEEMKQTSLNLKQIVTLASLIEKETGIDEERELISSVFHNRLAKRIPLQCDPTVIYSARLRGIFRDQIYRADLEARSPYNTYLNPGLPPGPIANPGLQSILAAMKPAVTKYLYFVSNNQGQHVFSATLDEHNRAVTSYRHELNKASRRQRGRTQGTRS
jgi:UPF0755 protein